MDAAPTPEGALRIGLAHGAVHGFSEEGDGLDVIAPDRARRAGLAWLALGDWHGGVEIDARTRYSGTPEPDRFKHDRPGEALLVTLDGAAPPEVTPLPTGSFVWRTLSLDLLDGEDAVARLQTVLPEARQRRRAIVAVTATGRVRLGDRTALAAAMDAAAPDFAHLRADLDGLEIACEAGDLDVIDRAGALREAADALLAESVDTGRPAAEREIAQAALARLHALAQAATP
jgi:hypothetical protein